MEAGVIAIVSLRLLVPLSIPRFPLWGMVASIAVDALDVVIADLLGARSLTVGGLSYHAGDKIMDLYFLSIALVVSLRWEDRLAKGTSLFLYVFRLAGVAAFEVTDLRIMLFLFPNLFENWYLFWAARNRYFPSFGLTAHRLALLLGILLVPKMAQEWLLHYTEAKPWTWMKEKLGIFQD